jgi:hypothetical protein
MLSPKQARHLVLLALSACCLLLFASTARAQFNVYFKNPTPVGVDFIGIVFYKQGSDGKDTEFVNEYQQNIGETNRLYATTGHQISLPAGVYTVYIIAWGKRELMMHNGNLTEYFARTILTVK